MWFTDKKLIVERNLDLKKASPFLRLENQLSFTNYHAVKVLERVVRRDGFTWESLMRIMTWIRVLNAGFWHIMQYIGM